ncbi:TPA: SinI family autotransporter-associated protein [Citrobacter freundii]
MQQETKQHLTKVALALALAGYCAVPAIAADGQLKAGQWQSVTENTGSIQGTVPWITRSATDIADTDKAHVTVTVDRGSRTVSSEGDRQFHVGDKVTINWAIGDEQGDLDNNNTATKATVQWMSYSDQSGADPQEIGSKGSDSYTIVDADADRYIGIKITPTTTTGDPNVAQEILLNDLSANTGGGSDSDDLPEGPVFDDAVHAVIYETGSTTNLLGTTTKLKTNTTYKVLLWKDKAGGTPDKYDTGEEVTNQYNYRWRFTGTSLQLGTAGGLANPGNNNQDLVIPITNAEAKAAFDYTGDGITIGNDGVQGYGLSIDFQRK